MTRPTNIPMPAYPISALCKCVLLHVAQSHVWAHNQTAQSLVLCNVFSLMWSVGPITCHSIDCPLSLIK